MWNYLLPFGAAFLAVLQLAKDWGGHKTPWRRVTVLSLIVLLGVGTAINNYYISQRSLAQHARDQAEITGLRTSVDTANHDQQQNTKQFVEGFGKLSQKVSDLQTQVATEALQKRLAAVQLELEKNQKAMAPLPKAKLTFSFFPYRNPDINTHQPIVPVTDVALPLNLDNTVHVEMVALNLTETDAMDGQYNTLICDQCKYFKEPQGFAKLEGRPDSERYFVFSRISAHSQSNLIKLDILLPAGAGDVAIALMYRCHTCELPLSMEGLQGVIHPLRNAP